MQLSTSQNKNHEKDHTMELQGKTFNLQGVSILRKHVLSVANNQACASVNTLHYMPLKRFGSPIQRGGEIEHSLSVSFQNTGLTPLINTNLIVNTNQSVLNQLRTTACLLVSVVIFFQPRNKEENFENHLVNLRFELQNNKSNTKWGNLHRTLSHVLFFYSIPQLLSYTR